MPARKPTGKPTGARNGKSVKPTVKGHASQEFGTNREYHSGDELFSLKRQLRARDFTIQNLRRIEFDDGDYTWLMLVNGLEKGLKVSKPSGKRLAKAFGDDMNTWIGRRVEIEIATYQINGSDCFGADIFAASDDGTEAQAEDSID